MALSKQNTGWHFLIRLVGLTGLLLCGIGLASWLITEENWGLILALAGAVLAGFSLLVEVKGAVDIMTSRRGALGFNVLLQVVLAAALLVGSNIFSFWHYQRFDWTRDREFTIDPAIRRQLSQLRGETRLVLYRKHSTSGDNYAAAAERQIVAKVHDLVEQFRELGPRFHVDLLDIQEEDFQDKLNAIKRGAPRLAEAIENAPEDSIFFYSGSNVQQLAFHDIYQLDKKASQEWGDGKGNLVLRYQGLGPFSRKVLNSDERKPRIAVGVIHEVLGLGSKEDLGMAGAQKALVSRGIDGRDLILKKWGRGLPEPSVLTRDEFQFELVELKLARMDLSLKTIEEKQKEMAQQKRDWSTLPLAELKKRYAIVQTIIGPKVVDKATVDALEKTGRKIRTFAITEEDKKVYQQYLAEVLPDIEDALTKGRDERAQLAKEQGQLNVEELEEKRRITDLRAKFNRMLADCDLLILPRWTLVNLAKGYRIRNWLYRLDKSQVEAIQDYLASGKPVLFCLGPSNEPPTDFPPPGVEKIDYLENLVKNLDFQLPAQTILFDNESEFLAEQQAGIELPGLQTEPPPVQFDWPEGKEQKGVFLKGKTTRFTPNPIRVSLGLAARSVGKKGTLNLRLRHPRPVYFLPPGQDLPDPGATFMMTDPACWNEAQPFPSEDYTPKYERSKPEERGSLREERRGPFPIAAAVEKQVPEAWLGSKGGKPPTVRVGIIGHGGVFGGPTLSPAKEKVLLDIVNWLLGRDDLLAHDAARWQFPRVALTSEGKNLWMLGTCLGMPLLFIYLGLVVLMVRRMR